MARKKQVDPIPEEFGSHEEAAEFWDTHDTTDYPDAFRTVNVSTEFRSRHYEVELEPDVVTELRSRARRSGVKPGSLANDLLRKQLGSSR